MRSYIDNGKYPDEEVEPYSVCCSDCLNCCDGYCYYHDAPLWDFYLTSSEREQCYLQTPEKDNHD